MDDLLFGFWNQTADTYCRKRQIKQLRNNQKFNRVYGNIMYVQLADWSLLRTGPMGI